MCSGLAGCGQAQSVETVSEDLAAESVQPTETVESTETVAEGTEATAENTETADGTLVRVASLKGPTSLGLLFLMNKADKGETANTYEFQMATGADEILPLMVKGDLDIALVPANVASVLYHKTQGGVEVIDINTLGVLYMVSGEDGLTNFTDLKGKTIYLTGKGTTPDYVLQYLLTANGMSADDVILEYKSEATEVASVLAEDPTAIGLLPQPFVTAACMQNDALKVIFDLNEEWNKVQGEDGSSMVTGVTVVLGGLIYGSAIWLLRVELSGDIERMEPGKAWLLGGLAWINAVVILVIGGMDGRLPEENRLVILGAQGILCSLLAGGLLAAACMDAVHSYVYNYVWWWCLPWTGILLGLPVSEAYMEDGVCRITDRFSIQQAAAMALFVLLQQILFAQMYGRADCHAFSVCALAGCAWQGNLLWFLIHMLSALTLLAAVQFCRRNVTPDGKLRVPKPFIPYIVVTFWVQIPVMLYLQSGATHIYA